MKKKLKILVIEDSGDDAELLAKTLQALPYDISVDVVSTALSTQQALQSKTYGLVISDHKMPGFSAIEALEIFKTFQLDVPFVIYSNVIGEEAAVEAMRAGATDYVMKENSIRLLPAIERDLKESERRRERKSLEEKLRLSEGLLRKVFESPLIGLSFNDESGTILNANEKFLEMLGYSRQELNAGKLTWNFLTPPEYHADDLRTLESVMRDGQTPAVTKEFIRKDLSRIRVLVASALLDHPVYKIVTYAAEETFR